MAWDDLAICTFARCWLLSQLILSAKPAEIVGLRMRGPANALSTVRSGLIDGIQSTSCLIYRRVIGRSTFWL